MGNWEIENRQLRSYLPKSLDLNPSTRSGIFLNLQLFLSRHFFRLHSTGGFGSNPDISVTYVFAE